MADLPRLALKVDCDTFEGTKAGIPNLLRLFKEQGIQASFYFTLGPDNSGRAIRRVFTQKGFLKKMLRSNAASMYGPKTMLYGTLLPGPMIGRSLGPVIRSVEDFGHECGVHGWDHTKWHDKLGRMNEAAVEKEVDQAHAVFEWIFNRKATSSAAPGWHATETSRRVFDSRGLTYTSDTRGGAPFFPLAFGQKTSTLEIPSTLPTWDEMLGDPRFASENDFLNFYAEAVKGVEVHSIHTEVEGMAKLALFERQLRLWKDKGVRFVRLQEIAGECLKNASAIPAKPLHRVTVPNRGGYVSSQFADQL